MKMRNVMKKLLGGGVALALSMAMAVGIFAGTGFEVEAAGGLEFVEFDPPESFDDLKEKRLYKPELTCSEILQCEDYGRTYPKGVVVDISYRKAGVRIIDNTAGDIVGTPGGTYVFSQDDYVALKNKYSTNTKWYITKLTRNQPVSGRFVEITEAEIDSLGNFAPDAPYSIYNDQDLFKDYPDNAVFVVGFWNNKFTYWKKMSSGDLKSARGSIDGIKKELEPGSPIYIWVSDEPATSETASQGDNETSAPHTHSYSWVTVQDVNAEQDGIEEYRCSCGDVQERCVLPRYMAIVKGLYGAVKDAPQNGTATFDTGSAFTMTDYVIRKFAERTDVTTVVTFKYQNQSYRMTIPAGTDYTELLLDEDYFYGYFYFANAAGATIEAL